MSAMTLSSEDRNTRVSALLRQVDDDVRAKKLDDALDRIRKVYEFDIKNIYARAYEERILVMMMEKEREVVMREAKQQADAHVDQEVKRRLNEFYKQQEHESQKRKQEEKAEQVLEERARQASVHEVQEVAFKDITAIEKETARKIEELERKLIAQIQQAGSGISGGMTAGGDLYRADHEVKLQQYITAEGERKKIQDEAFLKLKEEQKRAHDELVHQMEEERNTLLEREREKTQQRELDSYRTLMKLMMQLAVPSEMQASLLQSLKISFSISDSEHRESERAVQVSAYIDAVRKLWQGGTPSEEDVVHLKNLQQFFKISDDEHASLTKQVKKELGLPDETAVIIVIDDDPSIRKYVDHILKKTYKTVITAATAEAALPEIQKVTPSLIISDVNLGVGVMSGFTFYEKITAGTYGEDLKSVPYVLMSSLEDEFFVRSAKQMGVKAYLAKPFTRESIESTVKNALA
ncbi:MAG: response regulator [Ignavibacteriae bacterium]|nr:MAG: response regulator [Ignavibacteriota bacterium]